MIDSWISVIVALGRMMEIRFVAVFKKTLYAMAKATQMPIICAQPMKATALGISEDDNFACATENEA